MTLVIATTILMAAGVTFLAADKLNDVDIVVSISLTVSLLTSAFAWWHHTMKQCVWITKGIGQVLLAMKRNRVVSPDGADWCPADEFSEFMSFAQERHLTHPPGMALFGKTIDSETVLKGLAHMLYVFAVLVGRAFLVSLEN
jgi:hypothetical protein